MKLLFTGTADGIPGLRRANSSQLLSTAEDEMLLIDCGEPVSATLLRCGIDLEKITGLIITHLHADHAGGFPQLIQTMQLTRRQSPFTVYLPEEGIELFSALLKTMYLYPSILPFQLTLTPIKTRQKFKTGPFELEFYSNTHLAVFRSISIKEGCNAPCESFSAAVSAGGKRILFSGDIKHVSELIEPLKTPAELLVSELIHFPASEFLDIPPSLLPEKIIFTHFRNTAQQTPADADAPELKQLGCPVFFAEDLQQFDV